MIGPHEGRELELLLKGEKHLALFHDACLPDGTIIEEIIPEQAFAPYISNHTFSRFCKEYADGRHIIRYVCFTTPDNEWRAHAFFHSLEEAQSGKRLFDDAYEYFIGRLLDYTEADIAHFLAHATSLRKAS